MDATKGTATEFLTSLLNKTLRITTTDTRLFVGEFKCTDADRNIILSYTYEYRLPTTPPSISCPSSTSDTSPPLHSIENSAHDDSSSSSTEKNNNNNNENSAGKVVQDMTSRYLGLVVVPGEFITKIEVQEFASQVKASGGSRYADLADDAFGSTEVETVEAVEGGV